MKNYVLSLLVENNSGVLSRVSGLFSRRGYNITSLSVGETENKNISRMTIVVFADEPTLEQIKKQLNKLINTIKITEFDYSNSIQRELILVKVKSSAKNRYQIIDVAGIFGAKIIDVISDEITLELTENENKIRSFIELLKPFGIIEFVRSGITGIEKKSI
ncbi:acetolactate synthase small subunit [Helicovermis profundi]|uniref:Acetolactate synthase small subunit n=1 Tax=Helicovermis profundi TaxID=3065157 RepID=A0AAU9E4V5_9FIRM|nr:acetolactate synthase small subunit [Clostridia bacterium S502]